MHPGRFLPRTRFTFVDHEGAERQGPGWQDNRSQWATFMDPFDLGGIFKGKPAAEKFWERSPEFPLVEQGTGGIAEVRVRDDVEAAKGQLRD